ncbi:hypothetical protein DU80_00260 [Methanosarcina mazei]|uniref:Uncharacterized protein n=1 Tax=Methanosarcina mazei TaxID=2209 RepID=A0A0F8TQT0_METMZ|nr:hypothetical protein DU31_14930 [Methanosarcina mazei]KKG00504.1 hypothetical protein DU40_17720 [Methanosarcina mazei]KKG06873.1 hypothetical protein DU47_10700 [Methanosarcina mazei]KKG26180.1 hypothetical protein DU52_19430 [Methanosarcina mazei]KKG31732.1 hypothetical protein DU30_10285 [Methanosarcina mazei]
MGHLKTLKHISLKNLNSSNFSILTSPFFSVPFYLPSKLLYTNSPLYTHPILKRPFPISDSLYPENPRNKNFYRYILLSAGNLFFSEYFY